MTRTRALVAVIVFLVLAGTANTVAWVATSRQVAREEAQLRVTAREAAQLAVTVQEQRIETISKTCEDQNNRLDRSLVALAHSVHVPGGDASPRMLRELKRTRAGPAVLILRAVLPAQDCRRVVFNATGFDPMVTSTYPGKGMP
ncbi:MAG: hypothetical protein M3O28_11680 [Actinomycetota bacterium]|nr:hypothetical protein [Actinomycetota bacterium]